MSKLFDLSNEEENVNVTISTEDTNVLYSEILEEYLALEEERTTVTDAIGIVEKLENEVSLEERYLDAENTDTVSEIAYAGYVTALEEIGLSTEAENLPSTDVNKNPDLRQTIENKKGLIKKIVEGIKKMFEKLYKKAITLWAKIATFLNRTKSKLENSVKTISNSRGTLLGGSRANPVMKKIGFYYLLNNKSFNAELLRDFDMDNVYIIENLFKDLKTIHTSKEANFDELAKKLKVIPSEELAPGCISNRMLKSIIDSLGDTVKVKDKEKLNNIYNGVITKLNGSGAVVTYISSDKKDTTKDKLETRRVEHVKYSLGFGVQLKGEILTMTSGPLGIKFDLKEMKTESDVVPGVKDMIKYLKDFETKNKTFDTTVSKYKSTYDELEKGVVPSYAGVLRNSLMLFNKLVFEIGTTKRLSTVSIINNYASAVDIIASNAVKK